MTAQENFSHSASILPIEDMDRSLNFYSKKLNFNIAFTWEDPPTYAVLKRGNVSIHLVKRLDKKSPSSIHTTLYIFVYDINTIYERCIRENITVKGVPENRDYKIKDFDIVDPDGYIITFGCGV